MIEDPWKCKKTGNCCGRFVFSGLRIESDHKIDLIVEEIEKSDLSEERIAQLKEKRTIPVLGDEPPKKCIFLKDNLCQIYGVRPQECKEYPLRLEQRKENVEISIDIDCPRAEKIKKAIEEGNLPQWLEGKLMNKEIEGIKLLSFYEEKIANYRDDEL